MPGLDQVIASECAAPADERLREACVVVAEIALEPLPVVRRVAFVRARELFDEPLEKAPRRSVQPVGVETREAEHGVGSRAQIDLAVEPSDDAVEEVPGRLDDGRNPGRGKDVAELG